MGVPVQSNGLFFLQLTQRLSTIPTLRYQIRLNCHFPSAVSREMPQNFILLALSARRRKRNSAE